MKAELQQSFLLSSRPYLESSLLIDVFTREHGKISMVARGVKRSKFNKFGVLQQFIPLLISWQGKGPLYTMTSVEIWQKPNFLSKKEIINGLYINELLVKLLAIGDPHVDLFDVYQETINNLIGSKEEQVILRLFEKKLLSAIGYELQLAIDFSTGEKVVSDCYYEFYLERGSKKIDNNYSDNINVFSGKSLLALHNEEFHTKEELKDAKRLLRKALELRLDMKPLRCRELLNKEKSV